MTEEKWGVDTWPRGALMWLFHFEPSLNARQSLHDSIERLKDHFGYYLTLNKSMAPHFVLLKRFL
jgi:hypothetical protein